MKHVGLIPDLANIICYLTQFHICKLSPIFLIPFFSAEHRFPVAMSVGSLWDVGGPGAHVPSDLRGGQQRNRTQPGGPVRHRQPQCYLLLVHRSRSERRGSFWGFLFLFYFSKKQLESKLNPVLMFFFADMPQTCVIHVTQLERDTILVCLDSEKHNFYSSQRLHF